MKYFSTNSLQAVFFVLNSFTISLKTLNFIFESMSHSVFLIQERVGRGGGLLSKANKRGFQLKREIHGTCLTCNFPDVSLAQKSMKLDTFICLTYHFSDKLKIWDKFSPITHKLEVLVSSVWHFLCPYRPLNKAICFA